MSNIIVRSFIVTTRQERPTYWPAPRGVIVIGWVEVVEAGYIGGLGWIL